MGVIGCVKFGVLACGRDDIACLGDRVSRIGAWPKFLF